MAAADRYSPTRDSARRSHSTPPEKVDVALVGCGLGGLTCAAYLARAGFTVACFDPHYVAGGCGTQFARKGPGGWYNFDVGIHYIGDCGPEGGIPRLMRGAGVEVDYVPMDQDGFDTLVFPELTFRVPANHDVYRDRLVEHFPAERKAIDRYLRFLREVDHVSAMMDRRGGKMSLRMGLEVALRGRTLAKYQTATIQHVLDDCGLRSPLLRGVLLGQNGDYGLPPSEVSAVLHAGLVNHYLHGAWYPRGGGQAFADQLADQVEANGGSIHLRRGIAEILVEGGRAVGVRTEPWRGVSHEIRADAVVSNADIKQTLLNLLPPEHVPSDVRSRAGNWKMADGIFMTFLGVEADLSAAGMRSTNYWVFEHPDFDRVYREARESPERHATAAYITSATLKDPDTHHHSPPGISSVEIMTLVPGRSSDWGVEWDDVTPWKYRKSEAYKALKDRIEGELVAKLEGQFPGLTDHIVFRESATPVTHSRYTRATDGTGYGLACTPDQFLQKRPGYRGPLDGLYFCGASMRAGHGVVGAMRSGYLAARALAKDAGRPMAVQI